MTIIPVVEWTPDQADLTTPGSDTVKNVLARSASAYGPMPGLAVYSSALTARCQGACGVTDSAGNGFAFAGDATKLYQASAGSATMADVSKAANYTTGAQERWSPAFFGPNRVLMTNFTDPIQSFL